MKVFESESNSTVTATAGSARSAICFAQVSSSGVAASPRWALNMMWQDEALFLFVKTVDKAALVELTDERHVDELLGFGGLGSRIALSGIIENRLEAF
jgi:hypothetical protein